jgi:hypothetical protein
VSGQLHGPTVLPPGERVSGNQWIAGVVGPRTGLDDMENWRYFSLSGLELRLLGRPVGSQSLHRLRYRGSHSALNSWFLAHTIKLKRDITKIFINITTNNKHKHKHKQEHWGYWIKYSIINIIILIIIIYIYLPTAIGLMPGGSVYIKWTNTDKMNKTQITEQTNTQHLKPITQNDIAQII